MELVRGIKITDYCDEKKLSTGERLDLFIKVCQAIQHAHQKGIIHRDLKPSNILVTVNDGVAVPKVIDFGIAKATQAELTGKTIFTRFHQFLGTPAYMSPEQAEMTSLDIDTRSDIYSLGVLLYELLTGKTPFDANELLKAGLDEMRRTIREKEPARPSTRVSTLRGEELTTTAKRRGLDAPKLINVLRGDLDWIVMKCLEKDRARRYETANGLASDIQRHLNNEPVVACPPSSVYRFQKMVRRNKLAFTAAGAVAAALVIGLAIALWQSVEKTRAYNRAVAAEREQFRLRGEAEAERNNAQSEAAKSRQVAQFLADMFHGVAPSVALGRDTTLLKDILDKAAQRIATELSNQPEVEIELRGKLADAYNELGLYREEAELARKSLEVARARFPAESAPVAEALFQMAGALNGLGQLEEAEEAARGSVAIRRKLLAAWQGDGFGATNAPAKHERFDPASLYHSLGELGHVFYNQGKHKQAETTYQEALALARKPRGDEHEDVATQLSDLGLTLWKKDELSKAEEAHREALAINRKLYGSNAHPYFARSVNNLGLVYQSQGKLDDARALYLEALEMTKKMVGPEHLHVVFSLHNLASVARDQSRLPEAERLTRDAIAMSKKLGNAGGIGRILDMDLCFLAEVLRDERRFDQAKEAASESLALRRKVLGNEHVDVAYTLLILATILDRQGKMADAEPLCRECLAIYEAKAPDHWRVFEARGLLGASLLAQRKYADAEPLLLSGCEGLKQREDTAPKVIRRELKPVIQDLVQLYEETGRPDRATEWKQKLVELEKAGVQPKADAR
jgi:tetratricopeptide (TPR) repeat protein